MRRFFQSFAFVCVVVFSLLFSACRTNKEVAESMQQVSSQTTTSVIETEKITTCSDTAHWRLVYPKTAKTEGDLWQKGNIYTNDTNKSSQFVDTQHVLFLKSNAFIVV